MAGSFSNIKALIGLGNDVGKTSNQSYLTTFAQDRKADFCITGFSLPENWNGLNATI
jgi:hypothetical protein